MIYLLIALGIFVLAVGFTFLSDRKSHKAH
jgi:hypothetical protein